MNMYNEVFEKIQKKLDAGEISFEDAERLNDVAFEKYCTEKSSDAADLLDDVKGAVEDGKVKLSKDEMKTLNEILGRCKDCGDGESDDKGSDEGEDETAEEATLDMLERIDFVRDYLSEAAENFEESAMDDNEEIFGGYSEMDEKINYVKNYLSEAAGNSYDDDYTEGVLDDEMLDRIGYVTNYLAEAALAN